MTPAAPFSSRCRTCGREISPDAASCPHCGAANLEERCPNCGSVTTSSPDKELRYRCDLCGGPRLPRMDGSIKSSRREAPHLRRANEARKARAKYRGLAALFGVTGFATTAFAGLWLLIFPLTLPVAIVWAFFAGSSLLTVLWAMGRAAARTKEIQPLIDQAWMTAATDVARRMKTPFTAAKLAQAMGIDEAQAEDLLALLDANDVVRSDVTDAGEVAYQPRIRVDASASAESDEAELEAAAEAEAAGPAAARDARQSLPRTAK